MSILLDLELQDRCLRSTLSGTFDLDQAIARFEQILVACVLGRADATLLDYRQLRGDMFATHRILYALASLEHYREHRRSGRPPVRIAYLADVSHVSEYRPGMSVIERTEIPVILTTRLEDAERWLSSAPQQATQEPVG